MVNWNRPTFRTGQGTYDELNAEADAAPEEGKDTEKGDGRGAADFGGAPKPSPHDELGQAVYGEMAARSREQAEADRAAAIVRERDQQQPDPNRDPYLFLVAGLALTGDRREPQDQPAQPEAEAVNTLFDDRAREAVAERDAGRGTYAALRAEQSAAPEPSAGRTPDRQDAEAVNSLFTDAAREVVAQREEAQRTNQPTRTRYNGLTM